MRRQAPALLILFAAAQLLGCAPHALGQGRDTDRAAQVRPGAGEELATFAGGCFWCMEPPFEGLAGVRSVLSGYTGGKEVDPKYNDVAHGRTGHTEAVQVVFDPEVISYAKLLQVYWRSMDPTDKGGQFADRGSQYRPGIFTHSKGQQKTAQQSKRALAKSGRFHKPIVVEITPYKAFYPAENYHQNYYRTNPKHYKEYRRGSGRTGFLEKVWGTDGSLSALPRYGKPDDSSLRKSLTSIQYEVTQQDGTEAPFRNTYWNNKKPGIYVDVVSGEPLFSSRDKFASGTGWPSFTRPLVTDNVVETKDSSLGMTRTEVRSAHGDSHLGHLFEDGPAPTGLRYCINSASLRFVPAERLQQEGYGAYRTEVSSVAAASH